MRQVILAVLGGALLKVMAVTYRFKYRNMEAFEQCIASGGVVMPLWHNRLVGAVTAPVFRGHDTVVVVSRHRDGEIIARVQNFFSHRSIRGSSSSGGSEALIKMVAAVNGGSLLGVTADGPRGPRYVAKPGAAIVVEKTGRPALTFFTAYSRRWVLRSWDAFEFPKPFAEITFVVGNPIFPTGDIDLTRTKIEEEMRRVVEEGEAIYGRVPEFK